MPVSRRYRLICTKTAETAGTSVGIYFEPYCMRPGEWEPSHTQDALRVRGGSRRFPRAQPLVSLQLL